MELASSDCQCDMSQLISTGTGLISQFKASAIKGGVREFEVLFRTETKERATEWSLRNFVGLWYFGFVSSVAVGGSYVNNVLGVFPE